MVDYTTHLWFEKIMPIFISADILTPEDQSKYLRTFEAPIPPDMLFSEEEEQAQEEWLLNNFPEEKVKIRHLEEKLQIKDEKIEKLKAQNAKLRQEIYGRSSEKHKPDASETETSNPGPDDQAEDQAKDPEQNNPHASKTSPDTSRPPAKKPSRNPLPPELPRDPIECPAPCICSECGSARLKYMPPEKRELLHHVKEHWRVRLYIRHKVSCRNCETIMEAPAPTEPIPKGKATADVLAKVIVDKYCDHLPLYRLSRIYARAGVYLSTSTLSGWIGACAWLLAPLAEAIAQHVFMGVTLHVDDTPIAVLAPGNGRTSTGRFWSVLRNEKSFGSDVPSAVYFHFSSNRKSEHPQNLLKDHEGWLHADAYPGFNPLYKIVDSVTGEAQIEEVACWAHARRNFYELRTQSKAAQDIIDQIAQLFAIEKNIKGLPPERRKRAREEHSVPILNALKIQMKDILDQVSCKSDLAKVVLYVLERWMSFIRYTMDGRLEMTNNAVERAIRPIAIGRKNYMFVGSDNGGRWAAIMYTIIETCKMNDVEPYAYLRDILARIGEHPQTRIEELLPWNFRPTALQAVTLH